MVVSWAEQTDLGLVAAKALELESLSVADTVVEWVVASVLKLDSGLAPTVLAWAPQTDEAMAEMLGTEWVKTLAALREQK